ncbi:toll/interleukin-1 receptor domain-containing protein [Pedobacter vanadiisoli]|uniref:Toll/interleukin-1 receptor domain-containing protein n=1 Tax=Pedobacter vanadiisoli TaxID=1761975 RepID=A0ABW5MJ17_9SPHI
MADPIKIFISYGHTDTTLYIPDSLKAEFDEIVREFNEFDIQLTLDTYFLKSGDKWDERIKCEIESAQVVLFLISEKFHQSEYIKHKEFEVAIKRKDLFILHDKIFECDNYDALRSFQAISLYNRPWFPMKESEFEMDKQNRAQIRLIANTLYNVIKSEFKDKKAKQIVTAKIAPDLLKTKINRDREFGSFKNMINGLPIRNCNIFFYEGNKYDRPQYFNYRLDKEALGNNSSYMSATKDDYIDLYALSSYHNEQHLLANFIAEIKRLFCLVDPVSHNYNDSREIINGLYELLRSNKISRQIIPFRITSEHLYEDSYLEDFFTILNLFFNHNDPSCAGIFLYFLIRCEEQNAKQTNLFNHLEKRFGVKNCSVLGEIREEHLDRWTELTDQDVLIQDKIKAKAIKNLALINISLPARLGKIEKALEDALNDFN